MYRQNNGVRLSEWEGDGSSTASYREGPPMTQRILGDSSWSFGDITGAVARNLNSPPAPHEDMARQSPQTYVLKQEYSTPRQHLMRGQHGTPITISSDGSCIHEEYAPARPSLKRIGSPSVVYEIPTKRQQIYTSPGMMQPSRSLPETEGYTSLEEEARNHEIRYVNERQIYREKGPRRFSNSDYEHIPQLRTPHDCPGRSLSPHLESRRQSSYHLSPEIQFRAVQHHSSQQNWSSPHPLQHVLTYEEDMEYLRDQSRLQQAACHSMAEHNEQKRIKRALTTRPKSELQLQNEVEIRNLLGDPPCGSIAGRKQQPQLGSPIWPNAKNVRKDTWENPTAVRVVGRNAVYCGSTQVIPEDQINRRQLSEIPFTPPRQRAKTPSGSTCRPSTTKRGRSKSSVTASVARQVPQRQSQQEKTPYHPPSVEDAPEDDASESTPLDEVFRRQQRQGQMSHNTFQDGSYKVASLLPQDSIFAHNRPKVTKAKPTIPQVPLPEISHPSSEIVSLLSTPDASAASPHLPAVRSVPMKERIAPAKKAPAKKSAATPRSASRPKKSTAKIPEASMEKKAKVDSEQPLDPAVVLQKRAADLIVTKEIQGADEAMDIDLFGEVVSETEGEKARKEDEMRTEAQRKLLAKAIEIQVWKEAEEVREMEKVRVAAEKEENERLEKEVKEERAKGKRDAERKRQGALEERERDELRRKATEKIEADRKKAAEEAEGRERLKREAKEKVDKVQAEAEELAKLKAKKEEAKKQAASLSVAKISMSESGEKGCNGDVVMEEESLFLPETEPEPAETNNHSRAKSVGPTSAAQVFAQLGPKSMISAYRAEKEEAELRREKLAKESRLNERWKRQEARKSMQQAPPPEPVKERSRLFKTAKKGQNPAKSSKARAVASPPPSESASAVESTASQPIPLSFISSTGSSFSSNKSAPPSLPPKAPQNFKSQVKLISHLEREKIDREQSAKHSKQSSKIDEAKKAERRKKEDNKLRAKQRQKLIDEANQTGMELSEEDLDDQVEEYIAGLRKKRERLAARKNGIQEFAQDNLSFQALVQPHTRVFHEVAESHTSTADDEDLTLEEQVRRSKIQNAMRGSVKALAQQRNSSFARAAARKTVADFESDSESEEDPDPEPPAKGTSNNDDMGNDNQFKSDESDTDSNETTATVKALNPDEHHAQIVSPLPDMTASFEHHDRPSCQTHPNRAQPKLSSAAQDLINNPNNSGDQLVMLYTIKKELTFDAQECKEAVLAQFMSRKEANDFAAAEVQKLRQRPTKSISESLDDDDLYCATVIYDRGDKHQAYIWVSACPMSSGELLDFDPAKVDNRLEEKTWMVWQYLTQKKIDEETSQIQVHHNEPTLLGHFSQLPMANHDACARLIELLKPKGAKMDYIEQHALWAKKLREVRDEANNDRKVFEADIDRDEENLQWCKFDSVRMEAKMVPMKGPKN